MPTNLPRLADLPPSAWVVVAALLALTAMLLLRRVWARLLGPVFVWETERLARRRSTFVLRVVFVSALLAALYSAWPAVKEFSADAKGELVNITVMKQFSLVFGRAFLIAQSAVVLLFTPLYIGGAITDEREKRSLDFLLSTPMRDRDVVLGKFGSRALALLSVEMAALPVLAATMLLGGMDLPRLFAGLAATALTVLSLGSFTLLCSVCSRRTRTAITVTYVLLLLAAVGCFFDPILRKLSSPPGLYASLDNMLQGVTREQDALILVALHLGIYAAVHGLLTMLFLFLAIRLLRRTAERGLMPALLTPRPRPVVPAKPRPPKAYRTRARIPPVGDEPLYWKERYLGRTIAGAIIHNVATAYFFALALVMAVTAIIIDNHGEAFGVVADYLRALVVTAGLFLMLGLGLRLSGAVSREREQRTLESLLTSPGERREILWSKWWGGWLRMRRYALGLAVAITLCVSIGASPVLPCLLVVLLVMVQAVFAANLGLFLSVVCRSTTRAYISLAVIFLLLFVGTWAVSYVMADNDTPPGAGPSIGRGESHPTHWIGHLVAAAEKEFKLGDQVREFNPVLAWWRLLNQPAGAPSASPMDRASAWERRDGPQHSLPVAAKANIWSVVWTGSVYAMAAVGLWFLADSRFRRKTAALG
ncbi:MAG: ABC transporter permease [Gemmataceae bacterium]